MSTTNKRSFVVKGALRVLKVLRYLAFLEHVERAAGKRWTARFVDYCVIGCVTASLVGYIVIAVLPPTLAGSFLVVSFIFLLAGATRIIDITSYQGVLLLKKPSKWQCPKYRYDIDSAQRTVILLMLNYVEIILWFSVIYLFLHRYSYLEIRGPSAISALKESIGLMVSNTSDAFEYSKSKALAWIVVTLHSAIGLFMTVIVAARIISTLPELKEKGHQNQAPPRIGKRLQAKTESD